MKSPFPIDFTHQHQPSRKSSKAIHSFPIRIAGRFRHSFISYRVAETQDAAKVALEAGNSPQMIFSNYREMVTPKEAKRWFSVKPSETNQKVIWLKPAA